MFHDYTDTTWLAVSSTIWSQISLGLSILTACVPTLKGLIDSLLGSTAVAAIEAPYELQSSSKRSGIKMTPGSGSGASQVAQAPSSRARLKVNPIEMPGNTSAWSAEREINAKYGGNESPTGSGSESVRKLTEGVIMVQNEIQIQYHDRRMSISREGSRESSDTSYHMYG